MMIMLKTMIGDDNNEDDDGDDDDDDDDDDNDGNDDDDDGCFHVADAIMTMMIRWNFSMKKGKTPNFQSKIENL